jgi:hypothetical protein
VLSIPAVSRKRGVCGEGLCVNQAEISRVAPGQYVVSQQELLVLI